MSNENRPKSLAGQGNPITKKEHSVPNQCNLGAQPLSDQASHGTNIP
jgi:hypothetical protein